MKELKVQNISGRIINVHGRKMNPNEIREEENTQELKNLMSYNYLLVVE